MAVDEEKRKESAFNFEVSEIVMAIDKLIEATADYVRQIVPAISYIRKKMRR